MNIADALKQLGQDMGLPLKLDANRACRLVFDGRIEVDIEAPEGQGDTVHLSCAVGNIPAGSREALYEALLEANLFGRGTGSAVLGIDKAFNEIVLTRTLPMDGTRYQDFVKAIEQLVLHANTWTERIANFGHETSPPKAAGEPTPSSMIRI